MTSEQFSAWTLSWRPKNEAFLREIQSGNSEFYNGNFKGLPKII